MKEHKDFFRILAQCIHCKRYLRIQLFRTKMTTHKHDCKEKSAYCTHCLDELQEYIIDSRTKRSYPVTRHDREGNIICISCYQRLLQRERDIGITHMSNRKKIEKEIRSYN